VLRGIVREEFQATAARRGEFLGGELLISG
jgi:hypothetical protein